MATQITQSDSNGRAYYRVEGEMLRDDAILLEKIVTADASGNEIVLDLADLDFLDSEAAQILRRLETENGVVLEGTDVFVQSAIDFAERSAG